MLPYFYKLNKVLLSTETKENLAQYCIENRDTVFKPTPFRWPSDIANKFDDPYYKGLLYNRQLFKRNIVSKYPEILNLIDSCAIPPTDIKLFLTPPNTSVGRHRDVTPSRVTALCIPISPSSNYSSTHYHLDIDPDKEPSPVSTITYEDMMPVFLNTMELHSVDMSENHRISFQLGFEQSIQELVTMWQNNTFFK